MYFRPTAFKKHQLHLSWGTGLPGLPEKPSCSLVLFLECGLLGGQDPCLLEVWDFPALECILGHQFLFIDADETNRSREGLLHFLLGSVNCKLVPETISSRDVDFLGTEMFWWVVTRPPNSPIYCLLISCQIFPKHKPSPTFNFKFISCVAG